MYEARDGGQHVFDYMKSQLDTLKNKQLCQIMWLEFSIL